MKKTITSVTLLCAVVLSAAAQDTGFTQEGTIISPSLPAGPVNAGLPSSPNVQGLPGFRPTGALPASPGIGLNPGVLDLNRVFGSVNVVLTNGSGATMSSADVAAVLGNLQRSIEQALPVIASANEGLLLSGLQSFVAVPNPGTATPVDTGVVGSAAGANGTLTTTTVTGPGTVGTGPGARPLAANANRPGALTPTGVSNPSGLSPAFAASAAGATNNVVFTSAYRDTLGALYVLQNDLERLLPLVAALNGVGVSGTTTGGRTSAGTNVIAPLRTSPAMVPGGTAISPASR